MGLSAPWLLWHPRRSALAVIALAGAAFFVVHLALTMRREDLLPLIVGMTPTLTQVGVTEIVLAAAFGAILTAAY